MSIVVQPRACSAAFSVSARSRTFFNSLRAGTPSPFLPKVRCHALTRSAGGAFSSFVARSRSLLMRSISALRMTRSPAQFVGSGSLPCACVRVDRPTAPRRRHSATMGKTVFATASLPNDRVSQNYTTVGRDNVSVDLEEPVARRSTERGG